jgi:hypothetical protein
MAILKFKKMIEDLETGSTQVLATLTIANVTTVGYATSVGTAGVMALATSAANAGSSSFATTASKAGSAAQAGTARVAHYASSGTANIAGTSAHWSTGGL